MTIYGTPGGTPLNTSGFQGTAPGNPVGATVQTFIPGPGLFPPNSNSVSNDTQLAAISAGRLPINAQLTNALAGASAATSIGGRTNSVAERMAESGTSGSSSTIGGGSIGAYHPMTNSANGGSGPGAGGMNQDLGANTGRSDTQCGSMPASLISVGAPIQYQG